ncbi:hypothetical protein PGT21_034753 [Puccinia graminis f. sp. tritici]|uniref:GH26 domain-containing protein n=1 Tax=Puccinia graminis f. sp. tritici TaxID=56615 RepID=A0A5B0P3I0_PUCGR|nr:hypothetical protein PGTUg99_023692 [Puccinia graminis f. sp. tritici]KAA1095030.1 hypothetical protein PGT21_034753 [Puccinia graminis f. sp. tritici]
MFLSSLFVAFLPVLGAICDELANDDVRSGATSHASSTSRRYRHRKDHERISRSPARSGGRKTAPQTQANTDTSGNTTASVTPANTTVSPDSSTSAPVTPSDNSTAQQNSSTSASSTDVSDNSTASQSSNTSTVSTPVASGNAAAPAAVMGLDSSHLSHNGLSLGFLPDGGDAGGTRQTMADINSAVGQVSSVYGWYGQAVSGTLFDGAQLTAVIDDVKASGAVFQPAVMPVQGWKGLTSSDNSQAVAIAQVMKKFTDQGIPVWLRFAHEMNYYQTDGTYVGNAADFKAGWAAVAAACKSIAPDVKMWWTPNVASAENYAEYEPDDMSTVHLVGIDFYPKSLQTGKEFLDTMKPFHDKYAVDGRMFAIGETGLGYAGTPAERFSWLSQVTAARSEMKNYVSAAWFNYLKDYDYQIVSLKTPSLTSDLKTFLAT